MKIPIAKWNIIMVYLLFTGYSSSHQKLKVDAGLPFSDLAWLKMWWMYGEEEEKSRKEGWFVR